MSLEHYTLADLREEYDNGQGGLKLLAQTAWGWSELKVLPFLKQLEKHGTSAVVGHGEIRRNGSLTLKIPLRA